MTIEDLEQHFRIVEEFIHADLGDNNSLKDNFSEICRTAIKNIELFPDHDLFIETISDNLNLHNGELDKILLKFKITPSKDLRKLIHSISAIYTFTYITQINIQVREIKKRLKEIITTSKKLQKLLIPAGPSATIGAALFGEDMRSMIKANHDENITYSKEDSFQSRIAKLNQELEYILKIEDMFRESKVAEWLQYGQSGRKENLALKVWVRGMAQIWTNDLGRSLSFSKDANSGREKFLQFSECCFVHVHSELSTDTVRNAYENLRSNGKLDYLFPIIE